MASPGMSAMTTVMDIAADANVSTATVSRVLNGHPSVAEPTRAKVLDSINRLGYRMNGVARSLRASSTRSFGLVLPNIRNPFFAEVARAVEVVAMARGVSVFLGNADENVEKESRYLDVLLDKRVDAILISPAGSASPLLTEAIARGVPVIFIDRALPEFDVPSVRTDARSAMDDMVRHLLGLGHRRAAVISGPLSTITGRERHAEFLRAAAQRGLDVDPALVAEGDFEIDGGADAMARILAADAEPATVVFAANNLMTLGALRTLHARGIDVPSQMALVTYDDTPYLALINPSITTIAQDAEALGQTAVDLTFAALAGEKPSSVLVPARLIIRRSCGEPAL